MWMEWIKKNMQLKLGLFFGLLWLSVVFIGNRGLIIVWMIVVLGVGFTFYYNIAKSLGRGG